ncbi:hypothetical protein HPG69_005570, partial [Diceros bicornis minor]
MERPVNPSVPFTKATAFLDPSFSLSHPDSLSKAPAQVSLSDFYYSPHCLDLLAHESLHDISKVLTVQKTELISSLQRKRKPCIFSNIFPLSISNNRDEKSKEVIIRLHPQEGSCVHPQTPQTNQEND